MGGGEGRGQRLVMLTTDNGARMVNYFEDHATEIASKFSQLFMLSVSRGGTIVYDCINQRLDSNVGVGTSQKGHQCPTLRI